MTYSTSHLGISVLLIYFIAPKNLKEYLKHNPTVFFLTSLGAVLPDLDLFTRGHRAYGHSILFPLVLLVIAPLIEKIFRRDNVSLNLRIFSLFWITHMIYDTTFGPIALFFPIDDRFYDITAGVVFDLTTKQILPIGFFFNVNYIDQRTGVQTFFVNWTPEQRVQAFGSDTLQWPIQDFFLHATLFIWYLIFVILPLVRQYRSQSEAKEKQPINLNVPTSIRKWSQTFMLILLTIGFLFSGPVHGKQWVNFEQTGAEVGISSDFIQPLGSLTFKVPQDAVFESKVFASAEDLNYSVFVISSVSGKVEEVKSLSNQLLQSYDEGNLTYLEYIDHYQNMIRSQVTNDSYSSVNTDMSPAWSIKSNGAEVSILFGLYSWDHNLSFRNSFSFEQRWKVDISDQYSLGWIFTIISTSLTMISLLYQIRKDQFERLLSALQTRN